MSGKTILYVEDNELNRRLVRAEKYDQPLKEGDEVEIVTFVGGG